MKITPRWPRIFLTLSSLIVLLMLTGHCQNVNAQWSTAQNGNDVYKTNSAGNVGVGTTSPASKLDVRGDTLIGFDITGTNQLVKGFTTSHASGNVPSQFNFGMTDGAFTGIMIKDFRDGSFNSQSIEFQTHHGGISVGTRMVIDKDGNVGIGTSSPEQVLSVNGNINIQNRALISTIANERLTLISNYKSSTDRSWDTSKPSWLGDFGLNDGFNIFRAQATSGAPAFTNFFSINSTGNVGIGTMSPLYGIQVERTSATGGGGWTAFFREAGKNGLLIGSRGSGNATASIMGVSPDVTAVADIALQPFGGNVSIGKLIPTAALDVQGDIKASGTINAKYQDVAEWVPSSEKLPAGTVVVLDSTKSNQVIASSVAYDTRVAGVISAQPGITLGEQSNSKVLVATTGRVRVKVDSSRGPIAIGDLLVTSDVSGVAMKSEPIVIQGRKIHAPGTIIGKALEPLAKGKGEILVLLSLQ